MTDAKRAAGDVRAAENAVGLGLLLAGGVWMMMFAIAALHRGLSPQAYVFGDQYSTGSISLLLAAPGYGGVLDHGGEPGPHLGGDGCELVVANDRQHPLRVNGGDVRLAGTLVDDDVAG